MRDRGGGVQAVYDEQASRGRFETVNDISGRALAWHGKGVGMHCMLKEVFFFDS